MWIVCMWGFVCYSFSSEEPCGTRLKCACAHVRSARDPVYTPRSWLQLNGDMNDAPRVEDHRVWWRRDRGENTRLHDARCTFTKQQTLRPNCIHIYMYLSHNSTFTAQNLGVCVCVSVGLTLFWGGCETNDDGLTKKRAHDRQPTKNHTHTKTPIDCRC